MTTAASNSELAQLSRDIQSLNARPLWERTQRMGPGTPAVPTIWRYTDMRPQLLRAIDLITAKEAERRVFMLENPGLPGTGYITTSLYCGLQVIKPGEIAPAHRHSPNALRFIIEGEGAYTCTNGERCWMEPGDLILTPAWSYHDHKNEGNGPMLWLDGLDVPLIDAMDTIFFELYPGKRSQILTQPDQASMARFAAPGMRPANFSWDKSYSPLTKYPWKNMVQALDGMLASDANPYDDLRLEYFNPHTGGPVMPTIACYAQKLRAGAHTQKHRHNNATIYHVFRGSGYTMIEDQRFDWSERDVFVIPGWHWHEHVNLSGSADPS